MVAGWFRVPNGGSSGRTRSERRSSCERGEGKKAANAGALAHVAGRWSAVWGQGGVGTAAETGSVAVEKECGGRLKTGRTLPVVQIETLCIELERTYWMCGFTCRVGHVTLASRHHVMASRYIFSFLQIYT
jgi:hypothetical protein